MKTYTVTCAQDLPRYGSVDIQASDDATALTAAKAFWDRVQKGEENSPVYDADWCGTVCNRIVEITDADFNQVAADVPLDAYRLEYGEKTLTAEQIKAAALVVNLRALNSLLQNATNLSAEG